MLSKHACVRTGRKRRSAIAGQRQRAAADEGGRGDCRGERVELLGVEAGIKLNSRQGEEKKLAREQETGRTER